MAEEIVSKITDLQKIDDEKVVFEFTTKTYRVHKMQRTTTNAGIAYLMEGILFYDFKQAAVAFYHNMMASGEEDVDGYLDLDMHSTLIYRFRKEIHNMVEVINYIHELLQNPPFIADPSKRYHNASEDDDED